MPKRISPTPPEVSQKLAAEEQAKGLLSAQIGMNAYNLQQAAARESFTIKESLSLLGAFFDGMEYASRLSGRDSYMPHDLRMAMVDLGNNIRALQSKTN